MKRRPILPILFSLALPCLVAAQAPQSQQTHFYAAPDQVDALKALGLTVSPLAADSLAGGRKRSAALGSLSTSSARSTMTCTIAVMPGSRTRSAFCTVNTTV